MAQPDDQHCPPVYAVIPAAGRSVRMGQPKQLLPVGDRTMLETVVGTLLASPIEGLALVTHSDIDAELDLMEDPRYLTVINDDAESQMLDSIRMGVEALSKAHDLRTDSGILVCPGDMPGIDVASVAICVRTFRKDPAAIVVATFQDKRGHPIIIPRKMTGELQTIPEGGLAQLMTRHADKVRQVECETPAVVRDVDTPQDYQDLGRR